MSIDEALELLDEELDKARKMPLTGGKSLIDGEVMHSLIYEIRAHLPQEIAEARQLCIERDAFIRNAELQAERIISDAETRAKMIASQQEIVRHAEARAAEVSLNAHNSAKEIMERAVGYSDKAFERTELMFTRMMDEFGGLQNILRQHAEEVHRQREEVKRL